MNAKRGKSDKKQSYFHPKLLTCLKSGYGTSAFLNDLVAGTTVSIVAVPLAIAFAIVSGVEPIRGIYTAVIGGFLISLLGGSRVQIGGPTGAFVVIIFSVIQNHGYDGLVIVTLMAGVMLIAMGIGRFGRVIKYIPYPVTTGFTSGIALIIFSSQIKDFFGLQMEQVPADFLFKWVEYVVHLKTVNFSAFFLAVLSTLIIILIRKHNPKIPGSMLTVIGMSFIVWYFNLPVETVESRFGEIKGALPSFYVPEITLQKIRLLLPEALTVALLAAIESLLSAVVADGMTGDKHHSDSELIAQGVANIFSVSFGGIAATGAIARTVTNIKMGGKTPIAGIIHALLLLLYLLALGSLVGKIPLCVLAAILIVVAWNMAEIDHFRHMLMAPRSDVVVMLSVFLLTVLVDLTIAVQFGVVLASLLFIRRMSEVSNIVATSKMLENGIDMQAENDPDTISKKDVPDGVEVYEINGPFFFGIADKLMDVLEVVEAHPKIFILRMRKVPVIDATALHALEEFYFKCQRHHIVLILSGVRENLLYTIRKMGLDRIIGQENISSHIDDALSRARKIIETAGNNAAK